ncbi:flagella basal body P-ring formation protein FlgA, partial [Bradyrhizobium sp. WSM 1704]|uniref:flagella basal body P-ring formation protein FlgA n=1 Tax=Bradyrhizobium semiaridum TaxID=2821404 RepID=UPI0035E1143A|nr:flagella basal body P-ring formation protein FlgA [Bradyrhizobium semiaridum]
LGTTGTLPVAQVLNALRTHQVIGVDTRDLKVITVTRLARTVESKEIEQQVARALENRHGLGRAGNINVTFDRDPGDIRLEATNSGVMQPVTVRYEPRSTLRASTAASMVSIAVPVKRSLMGAVPASLAISNETSKRVERGDVLKASDVLVERRPKAEVGNDAAVRDSTIGMQVRRQLRAGQALRVADLAKPDLVTRDQNVT